MNNSTRLLIAFSCLAASVASASTHVGIGISFGAPAPVIVRRAPPPVIVERVAFAAPGAGYVWLPGHYSWTGSQWAWIAGAWVIPPRSDARWVDGNWNAQTQQWIEGHWEIPTAPAPVVVAPPPPPPTVVVPSPAPVAVQYTDVVVAEPPPPPVVEEVRVVAPGPGYIWVGGYWGWENGRRQWYRGHWECPPHGYRTWVEPRWEHHHNGYVFVRGYWR